MILKLNGLAVDCIIGERAEERMTPQRLRLDIFLEIEERPADTDSLSDTVDYAALAEKVRACLVAEKCQLIERAAKAVYALCLGEHGVRAARVSIVKTGKVPGLESAEVVYDGR